MIIYKDLSEDGEFLVQIACDGTPKTAVAVCKDTYELDLVVSALRCALTVMGVCNKEVNNMPASIRDCCSGYNSEDVL